MAHHITNTDGLVLAGQPAWHGLGTVLPERTDARTALKGDADAIANEIVKKVLGRAA